MIGRRKKIKAAHYDSLIGKQTELSGDVRFSGGLLIQGAVKGNVTADEDSRSVLNVTETGTIEGEVRVPNIVLNGSVVGDVHARERIELASNARVTGNVYYALIEMAMGAEVNGNLVHSGEENRAPLKLSHETPIEATD